MCSWCLFLSGTVTLRWKAGAMHLYGISCIFCNTENVFSFFLSVTLEDCNSLSSIIQFGY